MKSDPVPREKTGGGQVFRAWRGAGCWSRGSRFVIRWRLAPARPSLPNISTSLPPPRPPSPHRSLSLWYDIIVEFIVTLLKHHSYLFLSLSSFLVVSFSPLSLNPKKENTKATDKMHSVLRTSLKTAARGVAVTSVRIYHSISCQDVCPSNGGGRNKRSRLYPPTPALVDLGGRGGQFSMGDTFIEIDRAAGQERHDLCFFFLASTKMAMLLL